MSALLLSVTQGQSKCRGKGLKYVCVSVCVREGEYVRAGKRQQTIQKTFRSRSRHNWIEEGFVFYIFPVRLRQCHSHMTTDVFWSSLSVSFGFNGLEQPSIYCSLNLFGRTWCILKFSTGSCLSLLAGSPDVDVLSWPYAELPEMFFWLQASTYNGLMYRLCKAAHVRVRGLDQIINCDARSGG